MEHRTPVFVICSPLPRMGKTLLARLLVEFFCADGRSVDAFDVNPDAVALAEYLPAHATLADIGDTQGQMALFDQLIVANQRPKVVDLGFKYFDRFFEVMQEIGFAAEARRRAILPVLLLLTDADRRSTQAYAMLQGRFPEFPLVPVLNGEAAAHQRGYSTARAALRIPPLAPVLRSTIQRPRFSFAAFNNQSINSTSELYAWTRRVFLQFRELEVRLLLQELKPVLQSYPE